jgi:Restriction Endonuclease associating with ARP
MTASSAYYASQLRLELSQRNRAFALERQLPHVESYGGMAVTVYQPHPTRRRHGNFFDESYAAMLAIPEWRKRMEKVHTQAKTSLPRSGRGWKELDSSMSSDALLMNIFCCPYVAEDPQLLGLLGIDTVELPEFGWRARVPLKKGLADRTEVDMKLGDMLFEAKLTESDFQSAEPSVLHGYRDFEDVFEAEELPEEGGKMVSYQLIRNVLAAYASNCGFCVLVDARRLDLMESWYSVLRCVRPVQLRVRCKVLTWQELCVVLPEPLCEFLDAKYGIVAPGKKPAIIFNGKELEIDEP